jgi:ketosteroid isomerase-like protein
VGITEARARELLYGVHDAWNKRDIEGLLACYVDDLTFWANVGGPDGGPLIFTDKTAFRSHLLAWKDFDCLSVAHNFHFAGGIGRSNVEFYIRDPRSGLQHASTFRQVATFRDNGILRLEQYHDAQALAAFMSLMFNSEPVRG